MREGIEWSDRYDTLGPPSGCKGDCEGTGLIPFEVYLRPPQEGEVRRVSDPDDPPIYRVLWFLMEARKPSNAWPSTETDACHFLPCPDCQPDDALVQLARALMSGR